jgi:hypothetical protein
MLETQHLLCILKLYPRTGPTPSNVQEMLFGITGVAAAAVAVQAELQPNSSAAGSRVPALHAQQARQQQHSHVDMALAGLEAALQPGSDQRLADSSSSSSSSSNGLAGLSAGTPLQSAAAAEPGNLPPRWFAALPRLTQLRVVGCRARGSLPAELAAARQLNSLVLSHNKITGSLPEQLVQLQVSAAS